MMNHLAVEDTKAIPFGRFFLPLFFNISNNFTSLCQSSVTVMPSEETSTQNMIYPPHTALPHKAWPCVTVLSSICQRDIYKTTFMIRFDCDTVLNSSWLPQLVMTGFPALGSPSALWISLFLNKCGGWEMAECLWQTYGAVGKAMWGNSLC